MRAEEFSPRENIAWEHLEHSGKMEAHLAKCLGFSELKAKSDLNGAEAALSPSPSKKAKAADGISGFFDHPFTDFEQKKATRCLAMACVKTSTAYHAITVPEFRAFFAALRC